MHITNSLHSRGLEHFGGAGAEAFEAERQVL
jgi:hypothetical protein